MKNFEQDLRQENNAKHKKVLILGAGYVTAPVVDYLSAKGHEISLVSAIDGEANGVIGRYNFPNCTGYTFDCVNDTDTLEKMVESHDIVVSMLPYMFHHIVARIAIDKRVNMSTASYLTDAMVELHREATEAGITVINEVGVDPGIDHMLAMNLFHELQDSGQEIKSFVSFCGGLPAPEASRNPLGYKFSWSPRGVLLNTASGAKWLHNEVTDGIPAGGEIIRKPYQFKDQSTEVPFSIWNGFALEGLPNRDSTKYKASYNIPKCETLLRGTFRYAGYCEVLRDLHGLNLITEAPNKHMADCLTWEEFIAVQAGAKGQTGGILRSHLASITNDAGEYYKVEKLEELGLLSSEPLKQTSCPLDSLADLLNKRCQYDAGEKDAILMRHEVTTHEEPDTVHGVDFIYYGDQGQPHTREYSAMAQTVGLPCAIATDLILQGKISTKGMVTPLAKDVYGPILAELNRMGISAKRTVTNIITKK